MTHIENLRLTIDAGIRQFAEEIAGRTPVHLYQPIAYTLELGGKRLRPLLLLMACDLFDGNVYSALPAASGIEVFHNFTLLHDDIMDKAPLRRNQPTVHLRWNPDIAILSGDTMFVESVRLMMQVPAAKVIRVMDLFTRSAVKVCEGQQLDMDFESSGQVSLNSYMEMIEKKTAVLLAASVGIGAHIGGAEDEDAQHLYEFGRLTGIAFQLQDDLLDVFGQSGKVGKQTGGDILGNKKTFLYLKALEMANRYQKEELLQWFSTKEADPVKKVEAVKEIYTYLRIDKLAEEEMKKYYTSALKEMEHIPVNPDKKKALLQFTEQLLKRES